MGMVFRDKKTRVWKIRWDDPPGPNGERRQREKSCRKIGNTKEIAKAELARIETEINQKTYVTHTRATLSDLLDRWLRDCASELHEDTTIETERFCIDAHIRPALGGAILQQLEPLDIQSFYTDTLGKKKKLAPKTIRNIHGVLSSALKQGVLWKMTPSNPSIGVVLPKRAKSAKRAATAKEVGLLLNAIDKSQYKIPFLIALETGMRRQEILGLRWEDFTEWDTDDAKFYGLRVCQAVAFTKERGVYIKSTKTAAGQRPVLISSELAEQLRAHRKAQMVKASEPGSKYRDNGLINPSADGNLLRPRQLTRAFSYMANKLNIKLTLHELRHTQASVLWSEGIHTGVISDRVGWEDEKMLDVYGHTTVEMQKNAVAAMTRFIENSRKSAEK